MDNEEAIKYLKWIRPIRPYSLDKKKVQESIDLAIKALENARPQGEWIEGENGNIRCNQCGGEIRYSYLIGNEPDFPKFCPNCGADMRGQDNAPTVSDRYDEGYAQGYIDGSTGADWKGGAENV